MTLVSVSNLDEVKAVVNDAMADRSHLEIIASGSKRALGRSCVYDQRLNLSAMAGIVDYQPEELVLTLRAGTPMAEVQSVLAGARQMLAFEVPDYSHLLGAFDSGTIGGVVASICRDRSRPRVPPVIIFRAEAISGQKVFKSGGRVTKKLPVMICRN